MWLNLIASVILKRAESITFAATSNVSLKLEASACRNHQLTKARSKHGTAWLFLSLDGGVELSGACSVW